NTHVCHVETRLDAWQIKAKNPYVKLDSSPEEAAMTRFLVLITLIATAAFAAEAPTFNRDILPILQDNCQTCHRPGDIAPMSFLTFESTRPWAKSIKTAVVSHVMPPWFADPKY